VFVVGALDPGLLEFDSDGVVIAATEFGDMATEFVQNAEVLVQFCDVACIQRGDDGGISGDEDGGHVIGKPAMSSLGELAAFVYDLAGLGEGFLLSDPVPIATLFPTGKVWLVDGTGIELAPEDFLNGRQGVQPFDEEFTGFPVFDAAIELGADFDGETSDFAFAGHGRKVLDFKGYRGPIRWN